MKQTPKDPKATQGAVPTDWKAREQEVNTLSDAATRDRLYKQAPAGYDDSFAKLGMTMPRLGASSQPAVVLAPEAQALGDLQQKDAMAGLQARAHHSRLVSELKTLRGKIVADPNVADGTKAEMLAAIKTRLKAAGEEHHEALKKSPEAFMAAHVADLRSYRRQYSRGRIIQTPYVQEKKAEILQGLQGSRMCFISGETGTGKTEVARIVAREFSGRDELVVRGYAGMGASELYGHMTLTDSSEKRFARAVKDIEDAESVYKEKFPSATPAELADVARGVLSRGGVTTTEYILGAVYRAAQEGRVCIIDEANYIPPELLASLNDILTKKPGEQINVQQDGVGPITVQEGFGIIFTGNVNPPVGPLAKRYIGRREFDAAFTDRVPNVSYERLPQAVQGQPKDYEFADKQLFAIALTTALLPSVPASDTVEKLESRYGTLFLPGGLGAGLDTLWRFAQFAAVTQMAFHGEVNDGEAHGFRSGTTTVGYVPKVQLSNRGVMRVIEQWRQDGCERELDYYIAKDIFSRATDPKDRAYLYQKGQFFGFFKSNGWEENPNYAPESIQKFNVKIPDNAAAASEIVPAREVIEKLYGDIPPRTEWPDGVQTVAQTQQSDMAELTTLEAQLAQWRAAHSEIAILAQD